MSRRILVLSAAALLLGVGHAGAGYTIGNATPTTVFFVQGESFTPSIQGNAGTGTAAAPSGVVALLSFTIAFDGGTPPAFLSIYAQAPTSADAATGANSLGIGTYVGGGEYDFSTPVMLSFATKYYAVLPTSAAIYDANGNTYAGGVDLFPRTAGGVVQEGYGPFDIGFSANLQAVPEPASLAMFATGLLGVRRYSRRRRGGL